MNKPTDKEILHALQNGNRAVFDSLFREYYVPLCRFSNRMICSETLAEEATQNVFISLWKKRKTINIQLSLKAYLYVSTKNATLNMIKKQLKSVNTPLNKAFYIKEVRIKTADGQRFNLHSVQFILQND